MRVVVPDPPPAEWERLVQTRQETGIDRFDEMSDGELHLAPASRGRHARLQYRLSLILGPLGEAVGLIAMVGGFNLGEDNDYRIPDFGFARPTLGRRPA